MQEETLTKLSWLRGVSEKHYYCWKLEQITVMVVCFQKSNVYQFPQNFKIHTPWHNVQN